MEDLHALQLLRAGGPRQVKADGLELEGLEEPAGLNLHGEDRVQLVADEHGQDRLQRTAPDDGHGARGLEHDVVDQDPLPRRRRAPDPEPVGARRQHGGDLGMEAADDHVLRGVHQRGPLPADARGHRTFEGVRLGPALRPEAQPPGAAEVLEVELDLAATPAGEVETAGARAHVVAVDRGRPPGDPPGAHL